MRKPAAMVLATVMLYGCTATPSPLPSEGQSATTSIITPQDPPLPAPEDLATDGAINEDTDETVSAEVVPTWDAASQDDALTAASAALSAFARPELSYDEWWAQLQPHLTQEAAETYVYTDPVNVPVKKVTGDPALVESSSAYLALVDVATDVGTYQILMVRTDGDASWLASEFTPPPNLGP